MPLMRSQSLKLKLSYLVPQADPLPVSTDTVRHCQNLVHLGFEKLVGCPIVHFPEEL